MRQTAKSDGEGCRYGSEELGPLMQPTTAPTVFQALYQALRETTLTVTEAGLLELTVKNWWLNIYSHELHCSLLELQSKSNKSAAPSYFAFWGGISALRDYALFWTLLITAPLLLSCIIKMVSCDIFVQVNNWIYLKNQWNNPSLFFWLWVLVRNCG